MIRLSFKNILLFILLAGVLSVGGLYLKRGYSKAQKQVVQLVSKTLQEGQKDLSAVIEWESISAPLLFLKVQIKQLKITFSDSSVFFKPITVEKVLISPDYMALFKGMIAAQVTIIKPKLSGNISAFSTSSLKNNSKNSQLSLEFLRNFFVTRFHIVSATAVLKEKQKTLSIQPLNTHIHLHRSRVEVSADVQELKIDSSKGLSSSVYLILKNDSLNVKSLKIKNESSEIDMSMELKGEILKRKIQTAFVNIKSSFYPEDLMPFVKWFYPGLSHTVQGKVHLTGQAKYQLDRPLIGFFDLSTQDFRVDNIFLSQVKAKGEFKNYKLQFHQLNIKQPAEWNLSFKNASLFLKTPYHFQTQAIINNSRLNSLFQVFGLQFVPVFADVKGQWRCSGRLMDHFSFHCQGDSRFQDLSVYDDNSQSKINILAVPQLAVKGALAVTAEQGFTTDVSVTAGSNTQLYFNSRLNKAGRFAAHYEGDIDFSDIQNLIKLEPEGLLKAEEGSIVVDSNHLKIQSSIHIKTAVISGFQIGDVQAQLNYTDKGWLRFHNIKGRLSKSSYKGNVRIHIPENTINVFTSFPSITLQDLKQALSRRLYFPYEIAGQGALTAYISGPLQINALSYNLDSKFSKVIWEKEKFNQAVIQIESKNGYVKVKKAKAFKKKGRLTFTGAVDPQGDMQARLIGKGFYLQESANISRVTGPDIIGVMDFNMKLSGFFLEPLTLINIKVRNASVRGYALEDSSIDLKVRRRQVEAKGFIADKIYIRDFIFPYSSDGVVKIKASSKKLDIKQLFFHKAEGGQVYSDFEFLVDSEWDISYKKQKFKQSVKGDLQVQNMMIRRGNQQLSSRQPFSIQFNKGNMVIDPVVFQSGDQVLRVLPSAAGGAIKIQGDLRAGFLAFLFPFTRELNGFLKTDLVLSPQLYHLNPVGEIKLYKGAIQLHSQLDPFEDIRSDMIIDKNQLNISFFTAQFGGGNLKGKGNIQFKDSQDIPVNIEGSYLNVHFDSIEGISARGSGEIQLTGSYFPYTLSADGSLQETKIEQEFASGIDTQTEDIASKWRIIKKSVEDFEPIQFNLKMSFANPVQVENSTVKSLFTGGVKITGYPSAPLFTGRLIGRPGGSIIFRDHKFDILSAQVVYTNANPDEPQVDLRANTVIQEQSSTDDFPEEYSILLRVKGRGNQADFTLTSTPELTRDEIVSLMTFSTRSAAFEQGEGAGLTGQPDIVNNIARYSYYHLGPVLFQKAIGEELKKTLGVDQFLIVPYMNPKKNTTSTKLILSKKILENINLSASQTILDESPERDIKVEYKVSDNVSIVGFWKNEDLVEGSDLDTNTLGFDLEYQFDF